jgi:hypothetical protein
MALPTRPDQDDPPPPPADDAPGVMVWAIVGGALVLAYVVALALLRPAV